MKRFAHITNCPPADSFATSAIIYHLVTEPVAQSDFRTLVERNPEKFRNDCQAHALSVFTELPHAQAALKLPLLKKKFTHVASAKLAPAMGRIKNTPSSNTGQNHHSWWFSAEVKVQIPTLFAIVSGKGA